MRQAIYQQLDLLEGPVSKRMEDLIDEALESLGRLARPRWTYRVYSLEDPRLKKLLQGGDLADLLRGASQGVVYLGSLGFEVDREEGRLACLSVERAWVYQGVASVYLAREEALWKGGLAREFSPLYATDSFSPGYGDFPLACQEEIFKLVPGQEVGVSLLSSGLMRPLKSKSGIFGLSKKEPVHRHRGCGTCLLRKTCQLKTQGRVCSYG
ncbi:MAG: hypothetical protein Q4E37_00130 [Tissierellia bacterium]|nr:hypothetical protein [Tissierellia bacterium]